MLPSLFNVVIIAFSTNGTGVVGYPHVKDQKPDSSFTPYRKT
jgi:hypothetical protein